MCGVWHGAQLSPLELHVVFVKSCAEPLTPEYVLVGASVSAAKSAPERAALQYPVAPVFMPSSLFPHHSFSNHWNFRSRSLPIIGNPVLYQSFS
jgi:hypothetical protein